MRDLTNLVLRTTNDPNGNPRSVAVIIDPRTQCVLASARIGFANTGVTFNQLYDDLKGAGELTYNDAFHNCEMLHQHRWRVLDVSVGEYRKYPRADTVLPFGRDGNA